MYLFGNKYVLLQFFSTCAIVASSQVCVPIQDVTSPTPTDFEKSFRLGQLRFSLDLFRTADALTSSNGNLIISPQSVYAALLLLYFAASDDLELAMKESFKIAPELNKLDVISLYRNDQYGNRRNNFTSENRIFVGPAVVVDECFLNQMGSEIFKLKISDDATTVINDWVAKVTRGQISDALPSDADISGSKVALLNTVYFNGDWLTQFEMSPSKTYFYKTPNEMVEADMMTVSGEFNYDISHKLDAKILEIPYDGHEISMVLFLPLGIYTNVSSMIQKMTPDVFRGVVEEALPQNIATVVDVMMPKFTDQTKQQMLFQIFRAMGLGYIFNTNLELGSLSKNKVLFDSINHIAKININEKGTEAAAATAVISKRISFTETFTANRPFVYVLYHRKLKSILFMGVYRGP